MPKVLLILNFYIPKILWVLSYFWRFSVAAAFSWIFLSGHYEISAASARHFCFDFEIEEKMESRRIGRTKFFVILHDFFLIMMETSAKS